ncbi:MAG TPA: O-antigen ligase family protein [Candidatus Dormibacteraeota bacterium]|nr:O-antigen ligase family protein [Candidatus Dormibacteraeota bacterium]
MCAYLVWLPLLWVSGVVLPVATLLIVGLAGVVGRSRRCVLCALPWLLVGCLQIVSVIINMHAAGDPPWRLLRHLLASYVLGWFLLGGCVAIGASGAIRPQPFLRAVSRIGFYAVAAAPFLYALALILGGPHLHVLTPIGRLLPVELPSTSTFFGVLLYVWEDFFGLTLPRLSFLFPWATAMGFGGICLIWVAACEPETRRRRFALAGGVFMVFASMSRSAIVVLVLCAVVRMLLAFPRRVQLVIVPGGVAAACAVLLGATLSSGQPLAMFSAVLDDVREVRPGATAARDRVHEATALGVAESPLFGKGWPGDPVYPEDFPQVMEGGGTMVPGSHSTYLGLWYLGGATTLAMWILAWTITFVRVAASGAPARFVRNSLVLLLGIALTGMNESIFGMVVPTFFAYIWLGIVLCESPDRRGAFPVRPLAEPLRTALPLRALPEGR